MRLESIMQWKSKEITDKRWTCILVLKRWLTCFTQNIGDKKDKSNSPQSSKYQSVKTKSMLLIFHLLHKPQVNSGFSFQTFRRKTSCNQFAIYYYS